MRYSGYKCAGCNAYLTGRQKRWCSDKCRVKVSRLTKAAVSAEKRGATIGEVDATSFNGDVCAYCGDTRGPFEVEHMVPISRGGKHETSNVVNSCVACNRGRDGKHSMTVEEWRPEIAEKLTTKTELNTESACLTWWEENQTAIILLVILLATVCHGMFNKV